jgi:CBS domain-containing protein
LQIRLLKETVGQLLPNKPVCVKPKDKLKSAIEIMNKMHLGCVLVHDGKELVGIFTERDALTKLGRSTIDLSKSLVQDYMTPNPEVIEESQSIAGALNKMSVGGYRHLPVIRGGTLTGVISIRDILRYFWE